MNTLFEPSTNGSIWIQFNVSSNPLTTEPHSALLIQTYIQDSGLFLVDQRSSLNLATFQPGSLKDILITPASLIANDNTSYQFSLTTSSRILTGSVIEINVPLEI